ncbi:diaminopimelate epimerase [Peptoclostridium sp.]|uniref:diaminopimelate epimerase n=1 Tax=Peptoclostridium sp. TaxID=1904860 RepID=UPI002ED13919
MIEFVKLHGAGNDFIAIDGEKYIYEDYSEIARKMCHRRFGIGADGLLVAKHSSVADCCMVYYNSDGSRAKMCGNGLRCFVKYVHDTGLVDKAEFDVETLAGTIRVQAKVQDGNVISVKADMGRAELSPEKIPVNSSDGDFLNKSIEVDGDNINISAVLVGVPHAVVYVDTIDMETVKRLGPRIENHRIFPERTNVNFVEVVDKNNLKVATWERGCGYTLACGTGICASAYISNVLGLSSESVNVESEGGKLKIDIIDGLIYMDGPAVKICEGVMEV